MKNKICMICKLGIEIPGDYHVVVKEQTEKNETKSKGFYHIQCFRDRLHGGEVQKEAIGFIKGVKRKFGIDEEVVIQ